MRALDSSLLQPATRPPIPHVPGPGQGRVPGSRLVTANGGALVAPKPPAGSGRL
jgi:hypothetical protein